MVLGRCKKWQQCLFDVFLLNMIISLQIWFTQRCDQPNMLPVGSIYGFVSQSMMTMMPTLSSFGQLGLWAPSRAPLGNFVSERQLDAGILRHWCNNNTCNLFSSCGPNFRVWPRSSLIRFLWETPLVLQARCNNPACSRIKNALRKRFYLILFIIINHAFAGQLNCFTQRGALSVLRNRGNSSFIYFQSYCY
jgi:hypothetical protein